MTIITVKFGGFFCVEMYYLDGGVNSCNISVFAILNVKMKCFLSSTEAQILTLKLDDGLIV